MGGGDGLQIWRIAANIFDIHSTDQEIFHFCGIWRSVTERDFSLSQRWRVMPPSTTI